MFKHCVWMAAGALALPLATQADAAPVTGWVSTNGGASITDAGTNAPQVSDGGGHAIAANFSAITLVDDGDMIVLTGSVSFNKDLPVAQLRWGLFDGDNPVTTGDGTGYAGLFAANSTTADAGGAVGSTDGTATNPFSTSGAWFTDLGDMPTDDDSPGANDVIDFTLKLTKNGANVDMFASLEVSGTDYNPSLSLTNVATPTLTFDAAGFLIGGGFSGGGATESSFSSVDVSYVPIPEPASLALLGLGSLLIVSRRQPIGE